MINLSAFLHPVTVQEEKEIVISRRFLDEDGNPAKFKIRSITQDEADALLKQSTRTVKKRDGSLERDVYKRQAVRRAWQGRDG